MSEHTKEKSIETIAANLEVIGSIAATILIVGLLMCAAAFATCWEMGGWSSMKTVECGGAACGVFTATILVIPIVISLVVALSSAILHKAFTKKTP
jgi:hypothetical protein